MDLRCNFVSYFVLVKLEWKILKYNIKLNNVTDCSFKFQGAWIWMIIFCFTTRIIMYKLVAIGTIHVVYLQYGRWTYTFLKRGLLSLQVVSRYSMFPCSHLRDDCGFHWNPKQNPWILIKSANLLWISWNIFTWDLGLSSSKVFQTKDQ